MEHYKVAIVGSGPAGFTAAIYSSRALLSTIIFEGMQPGGQLTITTEVENYPGFPEGIHGPELMELFRKQAQKFGTVTRFETVKKVDFTNHPFHLWTEGDKEYTADAVIIATGASAKRLHAKGEDEYWGFGISACATCDGFFFKNQKVYVIGGGDSAMEEAIYLTHFASSVTIIHRRKEFRASKIMVQRAKENPKINFLLYTVVEEFLGQNKMGMKKLTHIRVRNVVTNEEQILPADGVFFAIGHTPNTKIFKPFIETDANGYIITKGKSSYTNIPGVFACGDCQDPTYRQAVSAAGSGCIAAIDAERWLSEHLSKQNH
ncbi:MAG: thioredoxin-disulfide reductase [Candidatus Kapaibacteriota bacterium]|jgi:thioredoxin reductase (NADPH)